MALQRRTVAYDVSLSSVNEHYLQDQGDGPIGIPAHQQLDRGHPSKGEKRLSNVLSDHTHFSISPTNCRTSWLSTQLCRRPTLSERRPRTVFPP